MAESCRISVKAIPNAPQDRIAGWAGEVLRVKVRSPALEGRANESLCRFLAGELGLPRGSVTLLLGEKSRQKVLQVRGMDEHGVRARLGGPVAGA
jgi:uncharacterized protein (TIGR00251 family)